MQPQAIALARQTVNATIRAYFQSRGYLEVETPVLVRSPGMEPNLSPFATAVLEPAGAKHAAGLITSPEYSMKKLLGQGLQKIFTLTKVFRNGEELGGTHNPEFTMLEWYAQGADYQACMDETESLVSAVCSAFGKTLPAFRRVRVRDLFLAFVGLDLDLADLAAYRAVCQKLELHYLDSDTESDLFYRLFLTKIEPALGPDPVFVYDYPLCQAALSRRTPDGRYGERFELYIDGLELCNGFTELTDAAEQRVRFAAEAAERAALGQTMFPVDEELLRLLPSLTDPTFGNALGVDRLHMLAVGTRDIENVILFPVSTLFKK
jgi:lysyl-tRNA synthetase class 2